MRDFAWWIFPFHAYLHHNIKEEVNTKMCRWQMHNIFHVMLFSVISLESILWPALRWLTFGCSVTVLIGCCGAEMFFHTVHPDILSVVFAVTKGGAWQTVLQHGEGRPEGPQQRGRGRDGMPLFLKFHISGNVWICTFWLIRLHLLFTFHYLGAAGLPSVSLAAGPGGPRGAVYRGLPPPAALLDARVVCQIHLHSYHSPWCRSGIAALHGNNWFVDQINLWLLW